MPLDIHALLSIFNYNNSNKYLYSAALYHYGMKRLPSAVYILDSEAICLIFVKYAVAN